MKLLPLLLLALLVPLAVPAKALGGQDPDLLWTTTITRAQFDQDFCCEGASNPYDTTDIAIASADNVVSVEVDEDGDLWVLLDIDITVRGSQTALLRVRMADGLVFEEVFVTCLLPTGGEPATCSNAAPSSFGMDGAGRPVMCVEFSANPEPEAAILQFNLDGSSAYDGANMSAVAGWAQCPGSTGLKGLRLTDSTQTYIAASAAADRLTGLNNTAQTPVTFNVGATNYADVWVRHGANEFYNNLGGINGGTCEKRYGNNGTQVVGSATLSECGAFLRDSQTSADRLVGLNAEGTSDSRSVAYSLINRAAWTFATAQQAFTPAKIAETTTQRSTAIQDFDVAGNDNILSCGTLRTDGTSTVLRSYVAGWLTSNNTLHWNITDSAAGSNSNSQGCRFDFHGGFYWLRSGLDSGSCCSLIISRYDFTATDSGFTNPVAPEWGEPEAFFGSPAAPPSTPDLVSESGDVASAFQTFATGIGFETPASQWFFGLILLSIIACTLAAIGYVITKSGDVSAIFASVGVIGGDILNVYFDFWELVWAIVLIVLVGLVGAYLIRKQFIGSNSGG